MKGSETTLILCHSEIIEKGRFLNLSIVSNDEMLFDHLHVSLIRVPWYV